MKQSSRFVATLAVAAALITGPLSQVASAGTSQYWNAAEYQNFVHFSNKTTMNGGITDAYAVFVQAVNTTRGIGESVAARRVESSHVAFYTDQYCQWRFQTPNSGKTQLTCWVKYP